MLLKAYSVPVLQQSQCTTKLMLSKNLASIIKEGQSAQAPSFHFWTVSTVKLKLNWNLNGRTTMRQLNHSLDGVLTTKSDIAIWNQRFLVVCRHPTRIINNKRDS